MTASTTKENWPPVVMDGVKLCRSLWDYQSHLQRATNVVHLSLPSGIEGLPTLEEASNLRQRALEVYERECKQFQAEVIKLNKERDADKQIIWKEVEAAIKAD